MKRSSGLWPLSYLVRPFSLEGRAAAEGEARPRWRKRMAVGGSGWALSRGSTTYMRGMALTSGDPPAFRFAKIIQCAIIAC